MSLPHHLVAKSQTNSEHYLVLLLLTTGMGTESLSLYELDTWVIYMALQWDWQPRQMLTNPPPSELYGLNKTVSEILASNPVSHTKNLHILSELNPQQLFSWMEKEKQVHI